MYSNSDPSSWDYNSPQTYDYIQWFLGQIAEGFSNAPIATADHNGVLDARVKAVYATAVRDMAVRTKSIKSAVRARADGSAYVVGGANFVPNKPETQG